MQVLLLSGMLKVAAAVGGAAQFAESLSLMAQPAYRDVKISIETFHEVLTQLLFRVPTPAAMVRIALNLTIQKKADIVPLLPVDLGDGPSEHELHELFRGCRPCTELSADSSESEIVTSACNALEQVAVEDLLGRVELKPAAAGFVDYYSHFLPILHLDFLEELRQNQRMLERPRHAVRRLKPEPSDDGKLLLLKVAAAQMSELDVSAGNALLLSKTGMSVLHGGAICFAPITYSSSLGPLAEVALDVGGKPNVREICEKEELVDVYSAVNVVAYKRQLAALEKVATAEKKGRFPLWELLPLCGVGGDIVDSWASKMRSKLSNGRPGKVGALGGLPQSENDVSVLKLKSLAAEDPSSLYSRQLSSPSKELNASQAQATEAALQRRLTVIQGPPGTGKTHVSVEILRLWSRMGVKPILVTSHNNVAVDNVAEMAFAKGLDVVRIGRQDRTSSALDHCSLNSILDEICGEDEGPSFRFSTALRVLKNADVVCVTTIASGTKLLNKVAFGAILMDEAAQTTEVSALVPLAHLRADRLVLVGDHCQLPATALSLEAETRGLTLSLFQRLVMRGFPSYFLDTQFRMHPVIAEHSSEAFYDSKLLSGVSAAMRPPPAGFEWPCPSEGLAFIDTGGSQDCSEERDRLSWCNPGEAVLLTQILASILSTGELAASQIGIVTPYMGQVRTLRRLIDKYLSLSPAASQELLVASVDSFQGREKELILFSAVRCNKAGHVGFLADWRRLNVMLTRARRGLIIVGDRWTLRADPFWRTYVDWAERRGYALDFSLPETAS